jgi:hypothetical protein
MARTDTALKIFISYARRDGSAFAEELVDALDVAGFAAVLDRNDIAAGEDWERRLEGLIAAADTIVFVVTPGSAASERCGWEIAKATALAKRIIPVVAVEVPDAAAVPAEIARLNYIFFTRAQSYSRAMRQLATALTSDADWLREHTRLADLARRWEQRERPDVLLLRGPELEAARQWAASATEGGPQPTELQRAFIAAGEAHEHAEAELEAARLAAVGIEQAAKEEALRRLSRRTALGLLAAGTLTAGAAGLAFWGVNAEGRFNAARQQAQEAERRSLDAAIASEAGRQDIAGQLIVHAVAPGEMSTPAQRSAFARTAIAGLADPDIAALAAFSRAQTGAAAPAGGQRPLLSTSLNGELYLGRTTPGRQLRAMVVAGGSRFVPDFDAVLADAEAWQALLEARGFAVERLTNPTAARFASAFGAFARPTASGRVSTAGQQCAGRLRLCRRGRGDRRAGAAGLCRHGRRQRRGAAAELGQSRRDRRRHRRPLGRLDPRHRGELHAVHRRRDAAAVASCMGAFL